jgi:ABC-type sulfate transport system substrate-binding protein
VRRSTRVCVQKEKVSYTVAAAYAKGDLKDEKQKSKCFLKCFAENLEMFNNLTGEANREKLIEYVEYLKPSDDMPVSK